jgi:cell division protein ZipA
MQTSGNSSIDQERFTIMYETAKQLSESLDTNLLDEQRKLFTEESFACVMRFLGVSATEVIHGVI